MVFAWLGFHAEGPPALEALLDAGAPIRAVLTLRPDLAAKRSNGADYAPLCQRAGVPLYYITHINDPEPCRILANLHPDVVFVIGWPQIVRPPALRLPKIGMVGAHASLLPHNRGAAPVNWALIHGEQEAGNTLFWLAEDVDAGEIIDQIRIAITPYDTCATLYARVAAANREMLLRLLPRLLAGEHPGSPRPSTHEPRLPRRRAADGSVDWSASSQAVYDFIRAITRPYHGAFSFLDGRRWRIWQAALFPGPHANAYEEAGGVIGPLVSPADGACGQVVACGTGAVALLELEADDGTILAGRALSDQPWSGKRWRRSHDQTRP